MLPLEPEALTGRIAHPERVSIRQCDCALIRMEQRLQGGDFVPFNVARDSATANIDDVAFLLYHKQTTLDVQNMPVRIVDVGINTVKYQWLPIPGGDIPSDHGLPGASGGPIVNEDGRVIGMHFCGDAEHGWAVKMKTIIDFQQETVACRADESTKARPTSTR